MNLPNGILEKLYCDYCKNYLSCGPILFNYKTNKVCCGRCTNKNRSATSVRYSHYEIIASVLLFPCKYAKHGCTHKLLFCPESTHKHETTCGYRKRACPMCSSKTEPHLKCKWIGRSANLLHHWRAAHPDKISPNPCVFQHDCTAHLQDTYLVTAFDLIFILIIQIANEIIVNMRLIGDETTARLFKFTMKVFTNNPTNNTNKLIKEGVIYAENTSNSSKNSLVLSISNLTAIFDGLTVACFKLTVERADAQPVACKPLKQERACAVEHKPAFYCRFNKNGCSFCDAHAEKCKKHEQYFCKYLIECPECNLNVDRIPLFKHFISNHGAFRAKIGKTFHINEGYKQYCILISATDDMFFLCKFSLACYRLLFSVFSPFLTDQLKVYSCEIRIKDPGNHYKHKLMPKIDLNNCYDWNININMYNYPMWRHYGLDLCVFIRKKGEL